MKIHPRLIRGATAAAITGTVAGAYLAITNREPAIIGDVPAQIADTTFWRMFNTMSEPNGYFRSDNFVSNETALQFVIPELQKTITPGGVYLGVGPDQNFTYIVALQPRIAFIVDIRRQNAMLHLMYKALIEMSADRAEFMSLLFSRPRPAVAGAGSSASELLSAFELESADSLMRDSTLARITDHLRIAHGFPLTDEDISAIQYAQQSFFEGGPELTYTTTAGAGRNGAGGFGSGPRGRLGGNRMPTYSALMEADDGNRVQRSYLANEDNFRTLKQFETKNLLVPLVGDFGGPKTLRGVGTWLKQRGARVSVFYMSNVEQYLFQDDAWRRFYANVATLPITRTSTFIRSVFNRNGGGRYSQGGMLPTTQQVQPISELLDAVRTRRVRSYYDVTSMPK